MGKIRKFRGNGAVLMKSFNDIHVTKYKQIINKFAFSLAEFEALGYDFKNFNYITNAYKSFSELLLKIVKAQDKDVEVHLEKEDFVEGLNVLRTFFDKQNEFTALTLVDKNLKFFYNTTMDFAWHYLKLLADCVDITDYFIADNLIRNYIFRKMDISADDIWKRFN